MELPAQLLVDAAVAKLDKASGGRKTAAVRAAVEQRFEWACTELGVDEVFLLSRLSKPSSTPPHASTLRLDARAMRDPDAKRRFSRAAAEVSDDLLSFARLLVLSDAAYDRAKKRMALPTVQLDSVEDVDRAWVMRLPAPKVAVSSVLRDAVLGRLAQYPAALEDVNAELYSEASKPGERRRMALVVSAGDQTILTEHEELCAAVLRQLGANIPKKRDTAAQPPTSATSAKKTRTQ